MLKKIINIFRREMSKYRWAQSFSHVPVYQSEIYNTCCYCRQVSHTLFYDQLLTYEVCSKLFCRNLNELSFQSYRGNREVNKLVCGQIFKYSSSTQAGHS